jgi:hypothetical protein
MTPASYTGKAAELTKHIKWMAILRLIEQNKEC